MIYTNTSALANASMTQAIRKIQKDQILDLLDQDPVTGITCDEAEDNLGMHHSSCATRILELRLAGVLYDTGIRRNTRSGRKARVYRRPAGTGSEG
jgi:hypothetical protein